MGDWEMLSHEGNQAVGKIFCEARRMKGAVSDAEIWQYAVDKLVAIADDPQTSEAIEDDVMRTLFYQLKFDRVISLSVDYYYESRDQLDLALGAPFRP